MGVGQCYRSIFSIHKYSWNNIVDVCSAVGDDDDNDKQTTTLICENVMLEEQFDRLKSMKVIKINELFLMQKVLKVSI